MMYPTPKYAGLTLGAANVLAPPAARTLRISRCTQANLAAAQVADSKMKVFVGGKQSEAPQHVHQTADANIPEEIFRRFRAPLSGFMNLRRRHRFGERQFRVFHHHPSHQRNEEHPEDAADHNQRRGLPVRIRGTKRGPCLGNQECGNGENRARRDAFSDRTCGSGDVLFEERSLPGPHRRHRNHCCRIGCRDGDSGPQTEVSVGRAQNDRHRESQQDRAPGKLAHLHIFRDVGLEFFFVLAGSHRAFCTHARILGSVIAAGGLIIRTLDVQILGDKRDRAR